MRTRVYFIRNNTVKKQTSILIWIFLASMLVSVAISFTTFSHRRSYQGEYGKLPPFSSPSGTTLTPANVFMPTTNKDVRTGAQTDGTAVDYLALLENTFILFVPFAALGLLAKSVIDKNHHPK